MITEFRNNEMNDPQISANRRVNNLQISMNSWKNPMYVTLSPNYLHSVSNISIKFARLVISNQSILWNSLTFHWFFGQFSNFLTFLVNCQVPWFSPVSCQSYLLQTKIVKHKCHKITATQMALMLTYFHLTKSCVFLTQNNYCKFFCI